MVLMVMGTVWYHTYGNLGLGKDKYVEVRNFFKAFTHFQNFLSVELRVQKLVLRIFEYRYPFCTITG
jgi:hypothetical protein